MTNNSGNNNSKEPNVTKPLEIIGPKEERQNRMVGNIISDDDEEVSSEMSVAEEVTDRQLHSRS